MPDPTFLQTPYAWHQRQVIKFGGLPVPGTGQILPFVDLNDRVGWSAVGSPQIDNTHISNKSSQLAWRGKGVWLAQDFVGRKVRMAMHYDETSGIPFSRAKAYLTQTGEQYLTFDGVTGLRVRTNSFAESTFLTGAPEAPGQYVHQVELEWLSRNPFMQDMVPTVIAPFAIATGNTYFSINYSGMAFGEPVFTVSIPASNASAISQIVILNGTSGEQLVATFVKPLVAGVAHTVVITTETLQILADGIAVAPAGSFPYLYPGFPPPSTMNLLILVNTVANAALTGATLSVSYYNQWEL